jgi:hypothetical protein
MDRDGKTAETPAFSSLWIEAPQAGQMIGKYLKVQSISFVSFHTHAKVSGMRGTNSSHASGAIVRSNDASD